jgi:hypothetical protein
VTNSNGIYSAVVPGTLDPPLNGVGYVLVVDALVGGNQVYHNETPVVIETAGDSVDLTTVDAVKQKAGLGVNPDGTLQPTPDDSEIQAAITCFSKWLLNYTGQATLNSIVMLDEFYDGYNNDKLFLRTYPIISLISVQMYGTTIPLSQGATSWGAYIGPSKKYIGLRGWLGNFTTFPYPNYSVYGGYNQKPIFLKGQANIEVQYTAGYPDVPPDLEYAVRCVVSINYKRKSWQDQATRVVAGGGTSSTTRYQTWDWPPEYNRVFEHYKRQAIITS